MEAWATTLGTAGVSALLVVGPAATAQANGLGGTFSGYAINSRIDAQSPTPGSFDGAPVEGSFSFVLADDAVPFDSGPDHVYFSDIAGAVLTFSVVGQTVSFPGSFGGFTPLTIDRQNGPPAISLSPNGGPYYFAGLTLGGRTADGLVTGFDPSTFQAGPIDFSRTAASFFAGRSFGADVVVTRLQFDGFATQFAPSVPEPEVWLLLLAGLGMVARKRR